MAARGPPPPTRHHIKMITMMKKYLTLVKSENSCSNYMQAMMQNFCYLSCSKRCEQKLTENISVRAISFHESKPTVQGQEPSQREVGRNVFISN